MIDWNCSQFVASSCYLSISQMFDAKVTIEESLGNTLVIGNVPYVKFGFNSDQIRDLSRDIFSSSRVASWFVFLRFHKWGWGNRWIRRISLLRTCWIFWTAVRRCVHVMNSSNQPAEIVPRNGRRTDRFGSIQRSPGDSRSRQQRPLRRYTAGLSTGLARKKWSLRFVRWCG